VRQSPRDGSSSDLGKRGRYTIRVPNITHDTPAARSRTTFFLPDSVYQRFRFGRRGTGSAGELRFGSCPTQKNVLSRGAASKKDHNRPSLMRARGSGGVLEVLGEGPDGGLPELGRRHEDNEGPVIASLGLWCISCWCNYVWLRAMYWAPVSFLVELSGPGR
jgi:hypothetical protein